MNPEILQAAFDAVADTAENEILKVVDALVSIPGDELVLATGVKVEQEVTPDFETFEVTKEGVAFDVEVETTITPVAVIPTSVAATLAGLKLLNDIRRTGLDLGSDWDLRLGA